MPDNRYQSVKEILQALDVFDPKKKAGALDRMRLHAKRRSRSIAVSAAVISILLIAVLAGFLLRNRATAPKPVVQHPPETVLIADFSNHTGNAVFDGTLESVVKLALEGAGFITAYDRTQLRGLGAKPVSGKLDDTTARQIAASVGVGVVVSGSLDQQGNKFIMRMKAARTVTGSIIASVEDTASNKDQVMFVAGKLVSTVRKAFGDETPEESQRYALETYTNTSLEVLHEYAMAGQALTDGKTEEALRGYSKAADLDENFSMAYRGMAFASQNMHQARDAERYIKLALAHIDRLTERERYRTRASYYFILGNHQKCVEEYEALISKYPSDAIARNNLSVCLSQLRQMSKALEQVRRAAAIFPKRQIHRLNIAVYTLYGSDFPAGEREARALQDLDPSYVKGYIALAFAQIGQGRLADATETYGKLEKLSKVGASNTATGLADLALYEGRFRDAARLLEQAATVDLTSKFPDEAATKFAVLAYTRLLQGQNPLAVAAAQTALDSSKTVKVRFLAGRVLAAAGQATPAKALANDLAMELQAEPQSYAKLIEGEIALKSGDPRQAIARFNEGNNLLDTWISRFDLGRAYLEAGAFPEADSEFDRCIKRRGEALALFLDESPTYGFFPPVYYYLGRVREGMKTSNFADSYRTYQSIRGKAGEDSLLAEVRKRSGV